MKTEKKQLRVDILNGSILKNMILFALPIMGTAFLQVLFSSVDTMVIGRFGEENTMASVGVGASVIHLIISAIMGLGTGVSIIVGTKSGKNDKEALLSLLHSLPITGTIIGVVAAIPTIFLAEEILTLVNCPESLMTNGLLYFRIYFLSLPFMLVFTFFSSVMHARGASFQPFVIQVSAGAINLILNLIFVIVCRWNVAGVAIATVISQMLSTVAIIFYFVKIEKEIPLSLKKLKAFEGFKEVFRIGLPASLETVVMNISGVVIQTAINSFDENVIAGNTVSSSIEGLMSVAFVGFSSAGMVFISQNFANGDMHRTKKAQKTATLTVLLLGEALGFVIFGLSNLLIGLYTQVPQIAEVAKIRMMFMCLPYGLCGAMNVMSGCVRGLGNTKVPLAISVFSSCIFRILWIYLYAIPKGEIGVIYVSYPLCWLLATTLFVVAFYIITNQLLKKQAAK